MKLSSSSSTQQTIAIIGGGAAGLMAAYFAKLNNADARVLLFEKNKYLGAKVIISGGGRCNVTTGVSAVNEVLKNYPRGSDFLRTAMQAFPPEAVKSWFESQGVPLKTEEDLRVFPLSNDGEDIVGALENALRDLGVEIHCDANVTEISPIEAEAKSEKLSAKFLIKLKPSTDTALSRDSVYEQLHNRNIEKAPTSYSVNRLILTTGGNAYRQTGSTGDGYAFAKALGHSITPLAPSLSSFYTAEKWVSELSGISFKKAHFIFHPADNPHSSANHQNSSNKQSLTEQHRLERSGPFLFTHKGVSGPAIFALSGLAAYENYSAELPAKLLIDFFPDLNSEQLEREIIEKFNQNPAKKLLNVLGFIVPHRLAEKILSPAPSGGMPFEVTQINCSEVSKQLRKHLLKQLKSLELHLIGRGAGDEFVTAGGVPLTEVDSKNMQSRLTPGLYFAGELLDVDGFTGGFNLQASWATGALAGESC